MFYCRDRESTLDNHCLISEHFFITLGSHVVIPKFLFSTQSSPALGDSHLIGFACLSGPMSSCSLEITFQIALLNLFLDSCFTEDAANTKLALGYALQFTGYSKPL